jgi:hypothetical protein
MSVNLLFLLCALVLVVDQVPVLEVAMHPWSRYCSGMLNKLMKCTVWYLNMDDLGPCR